MTCDRCKTEFDGFRSETNTAGYYDVTGGQWAKYALPGEASVCDSCMWADHRYIANYGLSARHARVVAKVYHGHKVGCVWDGIGTCPECGDEVGRQ